MPKMRSLRFGLIGILLPFGASLVPVGCIFDEEAHYYYPTALGDEARQLFAWPAKGEGQFRFLVQEQFEPLGDSSAEVEAWQPLRDRERIAALAEQAGSLTVLIPQECASRVRQDARELIEQVSRARPDLSTHCVVTRTDVRSIKTGSELHECLVREGSYHEESRPVGFIGGFVGAMGRAVAMEEIPNLVVVPLSSAEDRFAVYGDVRTQSECASVVECTAEELPALLSARLSEPGLRTITGTWGNPGSGNYTEITCLDAAALFVALYLPHDLPASRRAQSEELVAQVCTEAFAPIVIAEADTKWAWSDCTTGDFVRNQYPLHGARRFITGPVRQSMLLPKPEVIVRKTDD